MFPNLGFGSRFGKRSQFFGFGSVQNEVQLCSDQKNWDISINTRVGLSHRPRSTQMGCAISPTHVWVFGFLLTHKPNNPHLKKTMVFCGLQNQINQKVRFSDFRSIHATLKEGSFEEILFKKVTTFSIFLKPLQIAQWWLFQRLDTLPLFLRKYALNLNSSSENRNSKTD